MAEVLTDQRAGRSSALELDDDAQEEMPYERNTRKETLTEKPHDPRCTARGETLKGRCLETIDVKRP
jgi:hypothetical protein